MFGFLLQWIHYHHSFCEQTDIVCSECNDRYLTFDIVDDLYRCEICGSVFTAADAAAE